MTEENEVEMEPAETTEQEQIDLDVELKSEISSNEVRKKYRDIKEHINDNRAEAVNPNSNFIEKQLERVDNTFKYVKKPREAVMDSSAVLEITILAKERIKNVHCAFRSFNNIEFMDKVKAYMSSLVHNDQDQASRHNDDDHDEDEDSDSDMENSPNLTRSRRAKTNGKSKLANYVLTKPIVSKFGSQAMSYFRILPRPKFLLGSLEKELVLSKSKVTRQRTKVTPRDIESVRTKIKELDANSKDNETNNTVDETERIHYVLSKLYKRCKHPICLYEFMINPKSFSRTIENIFYISFLVKDGHVKIYLDEDNLPVIEPVKPEENANKDSNSKKLATNIQSMVSLNKLEWKELIEVFGIQTALIPEPDK